MNWLKYFIVNTTDTGIYINELKQGIHIDDHYYKKRYRCTSIEQYKDDKKYGLLIEINKLKDNCLEKCEYPISDDMNKYNVSYWYNNKISRLYDKVNGKIIGYIFCFCSGVNNYPCIYSYIDGQQNGISIKFHKTSYRSISSISYYMNGKKLTTVYKSN